MNTDRAIQYVRQALELLGRLEGRVSIPVDTLGEYISLKRNLESAEADLTPPLGAIPPVPGA